MSFQSHILADYILPIFLPLSSMRESNGEDSLVSWAPFINKEAVVRRYSSK